MEKRIERQYNYKYNSKDSEYPLDGMLTVFFLLCNIRAPPMVFSEIFNGKENAYESGQKIFF